MRISDWSSDVCSSDLHPITRGLPARFAVQSEQLTYGQHGPEAVIRGGALTFLTYAWCEAVQEREPMDWVRRWGKGRVYVTMLGHTWHDEPSPNLANPQFRTLLLRGTDWAATGRVTIPLQQYPRPFPIRNARADCAFPF